MRYALVLHAQISECINSQHINIKLIDPNQALHIEVQAVEHHSRVHLDIETTDIPAEVTRLEKLGAKKISEIKTWCVMEAPTGQRFCVVRKASQHLNSKRISGTNSSRKIH